MRIVVRQLDGQGPAMTRARALVVVLALVSMAHVGSPDTFFVGDAGPYRVRVSVRLPGVIPGRASIAVRIVDAQPTSAYRVSVCAGQWNVGRAGAPPPEKASPVAGDPALYSAELWFMTPTSYQVFAIVDGPAGEGTAVVPVLALATAQRSMDPRLGVALGALGLFLSIGLLTIVAAAVRESVLPPGVEPDARRRRRSRIAAAIAAVAVALAIWGGRTWWSVEAADYGETVLYRPFASHASVRSAGEARVLTLSIRDPRWTGKPPAAGRYSALMPDHGKLMHMFIVRTPELDAFAHLHPVPKTVEALHFDAALPPLPAGTYRVYGDIVHESGYAQTLVSQVELAGNGIAAWAPTDPDDSAFVAQVSRPAFEISWARDGRPLVAGEERLLSFSAQDASGRPLAVEPYMGMAAHVAITNADGSVFVHLHPAGSISMAALERFSGVSLAHTMHADRPLDSRVSIPYAFPKPGIYRMWVQMKREGRVTTAAFDAEVRDRAVAAR
jgi:hypothetical protein